MRLSGGHADEYQTAGERSQSECDTAKQMPERNR